MAIEQISNQEFKKIQELVYENIGVNLTAKKKALVVSRLSKRIRDLNFHNFSEYINFVQENPEECEKFLNSITTNVTKFYREKNHFAYLKNVFLPQILKNKNRKNIFCWSAACSTGEEPYTLAIVLHEFFQNKNWKIKILASDINTDVLQRASRGIYKKEKVKNISYDLLTRHFQLGTGPNKGLFKIKKYLRKMVTFKKINLKNKEQYPEKKPDFIFCRNVFIYFNQQTTNSILNNFYQKLPVYGRLFLGHSEKIKTNEHNNRWQLCQPTIYKKQSGVAGSAEKIQ